MPRCALKRREPLVKFVRRAARGHLEAADEALRAGSEGGKRAPAQVARARRELLRLRALLRLVRGPLGATAFAREHGAVQRLLRRVTPHAEGMDAAALRALTGLGKWVEGAKSKTSAASGGGPSGRRPVAAGPALLRALADLAEVRVRAAHWHVSDADFEALAPALRSAWRQSTRPVTGARAATPAALADAALTLHDQLRCIERVWPEAIDAPRQLARTLAADATRLAALDVLPTGDSGNRDDEKAVALQKALAKARAQAASDVDDAAALLRAEAPAAFTRRVAAYWDRWRGSRA